MLDGAPSLPVAVAHEIWHVLDDEVARLVDPENTDHIIDQVTPLGTPEPCLAAGLRERLTWKSSAKDVMGRNRGDVERPDVGVRPEAEVLFV